MKMRKLESPYGVRVGGAAGGRDQKLYGKKLMVLGVLFRLDLNLLLPEACTGHGIEPCQGCMH